MFLFKVLHVTIDLLVFFNWKFPLCISSKTPLNHIATVCKVAGHITFSVSLVGFILISTHILEEVDAVCTRAIIISDGKVVGYGTPDELMSQSMYRNSVTVSVNGADPTKLLKKFNKLDFVFSVERIPNKRTDMVTMRIFPKEKESIALKLEEYLFSQKMAIEQFNVNRGRLDEVFRELTN